MDETQASYITSVSTNYGVLNLIDRVARYRVKPDKTNKSQSEVIDLRATIVALREQLEILSFDMDKAVQRAVLLSSDEIQQLKDMASSLRNELENLRFEKDAAVQRAVRSSADEIQQLKNTIASLRSGMESKK